MNGKLTALLLMMTGLLSLSACGPLSQIDDQDRPADFALTLTVQMVDKDKPNEQYVIEPNRELRAALGRDVNERIFPNVTAILTPPQMDQLWQLTAPLLDSAPASPVPDQDRVTYTVTAHGQRHSAQSTLDTPNITDLLTTLRRLRGG